jgi:hypothetical protein
MDRILGLCKSESQKEYVKEEITKIYDRLSKISDVDTSTKLRCKFEGILAKINTSSDIHHIPDLTKEIVGEIEVATYETKVFTFNTARAINPHFNCKCGESLFIVERSEYVLHVRCSKCYEMRGWSGKRGVNWV